MRKRIKVAQFGLGPLGMECVRLMATKDWIEIVGAVDRDPRKVGRSLTEISGIPGLDQATVYPRFGEIAVINQPDAVIHTGIAYADQAIEQLKPMAQLGIAVVSSCEELLFPYLRVPQEADEFNQFCQKYGARILGMGVNSGYVPDMLPVYLSGSICEIDRIYCERVVSASNRRRSLQKKIGVGMDPAVFPRQYNQGKVGHVGLPEAVALIAHGLDWKLDEIEETCEPVVAQNAIKGSHHYVPRGMTCGVNQTVRGIMQGRTIVKLNLRIFLEAEDPHELVKIEGKPSLAMLIQGDTYGETATSAALINALPRVFEENPGMMLVTDINPPVCT